MLPAAHRMRRSADFQQTVRRGARGGRDTLVVHLTTTTDPGPPAVGLVVSRAVGNAVTRNRVKRRLRALVAARMTSLPDGALMVVRAQPPAASATSASLGRELDGAVATASRRLERRTDGSARR
ncbi:ribonuclease P protein component [Cellulomonas phragmiteti]|uniref:Ribonuclease P protein component n=1 Tax=Cellulomonas phragmiteti TaxID=478780 RepID=A0ABQ4DPX0_9CELL|nr:ribonuclease P protein component [Cellulomonas phragmiteti]GIG41415.1 ribonuclease P protein component [Cellulomonas phragmiteti]